MRGRERVPSGLRELVRLPRHHHDQVVATRRRVEVPQEPVGPIAERQRARPPRDPAFDRSDVADGIPSLPGEPLEHGLLRGERSQQVGLARLDPCEQCPAAFASPSRVRLAAPPCAPPPAANSAPSDASARCTLSSITVRSIRSANESASSRYAADAPGPNVMNACLARSFSRAWTASASARARARSCSASISRPCRRSSERRAALTSDARDRIRRWSSETDARASTTCCPSRSARSRAVSTGVWASAIDAAPPKRGQREQRHHDAAARSVRCGRLCSPHVPPSAAPARRLTSLRAR